MKDLTKIYVDLSKCSEEQIKAIPQILEKAGEKLSNNFKNGIKNNFEYLKFRFDNGINAWCVSGFKGVRTELTYHEFIKLFEGGEEIRTELIPDVAYWRYRCLLAEKCLYVSPCDPDITEEQIKAQKDYNQYLETFGNKD